MTQTWSHGGEISSGASLFNLNGNSSHITSVKKAELSNDIILRLVETKGINDEIRIESFYPLKGVCEVSLTELETYDLNIGCSDGYNIHVVMKPFEIKTLKLEFNL